MDQLNQLFGKLRNKDSSARKVVVSREVIDAIRQSEARQGDLFGKTFREENLAQVLSISSLLRGMPLCRAGAWSRDLPSTTGLSVVVDEDGFRCFENGETAEAEVFDLGDYNLRNRSEVMSQNLGGKKVFVVSDGSVMSRSIYELVKHGVEVTVTDPDRLKIHNPYRWGMQEMPELLVGRYKTLVSREIAERNIPGAKVTAFTRDFCREIQFFDHYIDEWKPSLIIIATDTEDSRRDANSIGYGKGIPVLYIGLSDRAESGQIILTSGKKEDPCYMCFKGNSGESPFKLRSTNQQYGIDTGNEQRSVPALSADINIIADIATKIAMVVLAGEDVSSYMKQFGNEGQVLWFSTKPDTWILEDFAQKIVARIQKDPDCRVCGGKRKAEK